MGNRYTRKLLSNDMQVACKIYELTEIERKLITFSNLRNQLHIPNIILKKAMKQLEDWGIIHPNLTYIQTKMKRVYRINPIVIDTIKHLYYEFYNIEKKQLLQKEGYCPSFELRKNQRYYCKTYHKYIKDRDDRKACGIPICCPIAYPLEEGKYGKVIKQ